MDRTHEGLAQYLGEIAQYPNAEDYADLTDEDMFYRHLRYVVSIAKRYSDNPDDILDYIQEGNLGLLTAIETWDRGDKFAYWAGMQIRSRIRNYIHGKDLLDKKGRHGKDKESAVSIDESEFLDPGVAHKPEKDLNLILRSPAITEKQRETLELRLMGMSLKDIGLMRGVTHQAVSLLEKEAINQLQGA